MIGVWNSPLQCDQWTISANVSLIDSEHKVYSIDKGFAEYGGSDLAATGGLIDLRGTTPPWAADATVSLSVSYDIDLGSAGTLTPFFRLFYSSEYNTDDLVTYPGQVQEAYSKLDIRVF